MQLYVCICINSYGYVHLNLSDNSVTNTSNQACNWQQFYVDPKYTGRAPALSAALPTPMIIIVKSKIGHQPFLALSEWACEDEMFLCTNRKHQQLAFNNCSWDNLKRTPRILVYYDVVEEKKDCLLLCLSHSCRPSSYNLSSPFSKYWRKGSKSWIITTVIVDIISQTMEGKFKESVIQMLSSRPGKTQ